MDKKHAGLRLSQALFQALYAVSNALVLMITQGRVCSYHAHFSDADAEAESLPKVTELGHGGAISSGSGVLGLQDTQSAGWWADTQSLHRIMTERAGRGGFGQGWDKIRICMLGTPLAAGRGH